MELRHPARATRSTPLEVRYVGNHATGLYRGNDLDQVNLTPALVSEFNAAVANLSGANNPTPVLTSINSPSSLLNSSTFRNLLLQNQAGSFWYLVQSNCTMLFLTKAGCAGLGTFPANFFIPNPVTGVARILYNGMHSSYNGLQAEVRRRFAGGLQMQANYTWAKVLSNSGIAGSQSELDVDLDLRQPGYSRSRADYDIRHTFHVNSVYQFPIGRGRRFLSRSILGKALEGWQAGGMATARTGIPTTIVSGRATVTRNAGTNPAVAVGVTDRQICDAIGVYKIGAGIYSLPAEYWLAGSTAGSTIGANPNRLANPAAGSLGDHPLRKGACSGRGFYQIDMNLVKKVKITERLRFEFRAEFFNILNHVSFSFPSAPNINNSGFGTLTGTVTGPREIQFNGRISF